MLPVLNRETELGRAALAETAAVQLQEEERRLHNHLQHAQRGGMDTVSTDGLVTDRQAAQTERQDLSDEEEKEEGERERLTGRYITNPIRLAHSLP